MAKTSTPSSLKLGKRGERFKCEMVVTKSPALSAITPPNCRLAALSSLSAAPRLPSSVAPDHRLVNDICRVLSDHRAPHHDLAAALRPFAPSLTPSAAEQVLKRCVHLPSPAHRFFLWSAALPGFRHSACAHLVHVESLAAARQFPLLWSFLFDLRGASRGGEERDNHLGRSPETFWVIFRAYARARLPNDAVRAFRRMSDFGLEPGLDDLHQLLHSLCRNGLVEAAQSFFDQSKSRFPVDRKTFSILINGWGELGNSKEAMKLFDEMIERGCPLDVVAYNSLILALCRSGELHEAHARLQEMQKVHSLKPDAATYSAFIHAAYKERNLHSVIKVLDRMRRHNLVPNVFTYNAIIRLLCEKEKMAEAYELLDEMIEHGSKPDVWSYNTILVVHCRLHEVSKALKLLERMEKDECSPDRHTYNMLLKMLIGVGRIDRAMEVWDGMQRKQYYPCASSYAVMIHGLCKKKGKVEDACSYFKVMIDEGVPPYLSTCKLIRDKLLQLGLRDEVFIIRNKMRHSTSCTIQELSNVMEGREIADHRKELSERGTLAAGY